MLEVTERQTIARPPEVVLAFLADTTNEPRWHPYAREVRRTSPGPVDAGTTFEGRYRGMGTVTTTITDYRPGSRLVFSSRASGLEFESTATATGDAAHTDLTVSLRLGPRGLYRLLAPVMKPLLRRQFAARMTALKAALEASH